MMQLSAISGSDGDIYNTKQSSVGTYALSLGKPANVSMIGMSLFNIINLPCIATVYVNVIVMLKETSGELQPLVVQS